MRQVITWVYKAKVSKLPLTMAHNEQVLPMAGIYVRQIGTAASLFDKVK